MWLAEAAVVAKMLVSWNGDEDGIKIAVKTKYKKITKHQGGRVIEVYGYALSGYSVTTY